MNAQEVVDVNSQYGLDYVVRVLRRLEDKEREALVYGVIRIHPKLGIELARRTINNRDYFLWLGDKIYDETDVSDIRYWINCLFHRVGIRKTLEILGRNAPGHADEAKGALYWIPFLLKEQGVSDKYQSELEGFRALVEQEDWH